jgi:photosystem II Psb27 protein
MQRIWSRLIVLVLVVVIGLSGCSNTPSGLVGNYQKDTLTVVQNLRTALELPDDSPEKSAAQSLARENINDFAALYRKDSGLIKLSSYTTMRTVLNSLAAHYASYPNRPVPDKLKERLELELSQIESAIDRGA